MSALSASQAPGLNCQPGEYFLLFVNIIPNSQDTPANKMDISLRKKKENDI